MASDVRQRITTSLDSENEDSENVVATQNIIGSCCGQHSQIHGLDGCGCKSDHWEDKMSNDVQKEEEDEQEIIPLNTVEPKVLGNKARFRKLARILKVLSETPLNGTSLRQLAISKGGLLEDSVRRKVWPKLIEIEPYEVFPKPTFAEIQKHKDYDQVVLDVRRCLRRFPPGIQVERRMAMQDQLTNLIVRVLLKHPDLCYYQGYHDICVTFLLVVGEELGFALMEILSSTRLRVFMEPTMESTVRIMNYIYPILGKFSPRLLKHLEKADVSPMFCLSWLITWFGHVLNSYSQIVRLYDFFLATHSLMPIYLAAAVVLHREKDVLNLETDMAVIHHFLSNVPDELPFETLISKAVTMFREYPPAELMAAANLSRGIYPQRRRWISLSYKNTLIGRAIQKLWTTLSPVHLTSRRRWLTAVITILPLALAVYFYNFSLKDINRHLRWRT